MTERDQFYLTVHGYLLGQVHTVTLDVVSNVLEFTVEPAGGEFHHEVAKKALLPDLMVRVRVVSAAVGDDLGFDTNGTTIERRGDLVAVRFAVPKAVRDGGLIARVAARAETL